LLDPVSPAVGGSVKHQAEPGTTEDDPVVGHVQEQAWLRHLWLTWMKNRKPRRVTPGLRESSGTNGSLGDQFPFESFIRR
jgi:hypothetical protein